MTGSPQQDDQQGNRRFGVVNSYYKEFGPYLALGFQLAVAVIVFYFLGSWVDTKFDTTPAFTLVGVMLGTVGGLIKFFKTVTELSKKEESSRKERRRED